MGVFRFRLFWSGRKMGAVGGRAALSVGPR